VRKLEPKEVFSYGKYKKRCNYPNGLIDKEKAIIADGLSSMAPSLVGCCNQKAMIELGTTRKLNNFILDFNPKKPIKR
jgi:hypothetical protein